MQLVALRYENLRAHEVDAGHHFGDSVFDLNARIHFDEIPFLSVDVVEELDCACVAVVCFSRQTNRGIAQFRRERMTADSRRAPLRRLSGDAAARSNRVRKGAADFRDCRPESGPQDGAREANIFPERRWRRRTPILLRPGLPRDVARVPLRCAPRACRARRRPSRPLQ